MLNMKCYWSGDSCEKCIKYRKDRCSIYQYLLEQKTSMNKKVFEKKKVNKFGKR